MSSVPGKRPAPGWKDYVLCYALFALLLVLAFVVVFIIGRMTILAMLSTFFADSAWSTPRLIYMLSILLLGMVGFILIMVGEPYLRGGVERGNLGRRFVRIAMPFVVAGALGLLFAVVAGFVAG